MIFSSRNYIVKSQLRLRPVCWFYVVDVIIFYLPPGLFIVQGFVLSPDFQAYPMTNLPLVTHCPYSVLKLVLIVPFFLFSKEPLLFLENVFFLGFSLCLPPSVTPTEMHSRVITLLWYPTEHPHSLDVAMETSLHPISLHRRPDLKLQEWAKATHPKWRKYNRWSYFSSTHGWVRVKYEMCRITQAKSSFDMILP